MKILKNLLLILAILIISASSYVSLNYSYKLTRLLKHTDTSTQKNTVCKKHLGRIWLISYADGKAYIANQRALTYSALNNCIDYFMHFGPHSIDKEYFAKHKSILSQPRGAGYWLWKPYLILKTLKQIPENDLVLYVDVGAMLIKPIDSLIEHLGNKDILLFKNFHQNKGYIKRDLLKMMNMDNNEVLNARHLQGGFVLIRNTKNARNFIKKWLTLCENEHAVTDSPSVAEEYPSFLDHRHDQAILSLLSLQNPEKIVLMESNKTDEYFLLHSRRSVRRLLLFDYKLTKLEKGLNRLMLKLETIIQKLKHKIQTTKTNN